MIKKEAGGIAKVSLKHYPEPFFEDLLRYYPRYFIEKKWGNDKKKGKFGVGLFEFRENLGVEIRFYRTLAWKKSHN